MITEDLGTIWVYYYYTRKEPTKTIMMIIGFHGLYKNISVLQRGDRLWRL